MSKKYEVTVRFTKKVSQKELANAVKQATKASIKGFGLDNIATNQAYPMETPRAISGPRRKTKKKGGKKK